MASRLITRENSQAEEAMEMYEPSASELEKALNDVYYEIQQLAFTAVLATDHPGFNNAVVESRLLHVRTLIDFLEVTGRTKDDVLAAHYGFPAARLPIEHVYRERLNKDLAHLTYSRTRRTPCDKGWPHERVVLPVLERSRAFIDHVLGSRSTYGEQGRASWEGLRTAVVGVLTPKFGCGGG